jgi:hypothetical protein
LCQRNFGHGALLSDRDTVPTSFSTPIIVYLN